ncbi:Lactonase, 7-bladed beta-propeller-domain-containing protein [Talaromyces proteolyticus]|uniref:Lactonase, 7-bladed beta-propeller-domain-containing protein n=1 Tax=Talaromyces proteolyticus TaxID=1131652 RepID=A0AAD4L2N6_9EURO|nr:Lactonase, 7-bladed beta-propeller-domain-containing protein [Talaromyces proteolyticus]KAH8704812.1 Lactonase, 7-bladed beta-propeller-domain-containing protein [Talaromyces proteolyticus]
MTMVILSTLLTMVVAAAAAPSTLFVSHYDGHIYTLTLSSNNSLTQTGALTACGSMPSWLTYSSATNTLYCVDESGTTGSSNGTLSAFTPENDGLKQLVKTNTLPGGVASVVYTADAGDFLAIAHYEGSAVSVFPLPLTSTSTASQSFEYTLTNPPTDPSRQDAPHPHEVFLDPTGAFILAPDLGMDVIHIYAIDKASGRLTECDQFAVKGGNGPRHGAWWTSNSTISGRGRGRGHGSGSGSKGDTVLYIANELANTVSIYTATYSDTCLALADAGEVTPYPGPVPSSGNIAEVRVVQGRDVYVSVRNDQAFAPADSMAFLQIPNGEDGTGVQYVNLTSSYGKTPRTFVVSKDGGLVAIGDQASAEVAVVRRDAATGELGELIAKVRVGQQGTPGQSDGLSSVVWAE